MVTDTHAEQRSPARSVAVALTCTLLIASTYGMARFGVGLFAPRLVTERAVEGAEAAEIGLARGGRHGVHASASLSNAALYKRALMI